MEETSMNLSHLTNSQKCFDKVFSETSFLCYADSSPKNEQSLSNENTNECSMFATNDDIRCGQILLNRESEHIPDQEQEEDTQWDHDQEQRTQFKDKLPSNPVISDKPKAKKNLTKRPPDTENRQEDKDGCSSDQPSSRKEPKKESFLSNIKTSPQNPRDINLLRMRFNAYWPRVELRLVRFLGVVRTHIQNIYLRHTFVSPQQVNDPFIELILHQLYSIILPSYNHSQPTAADPRAGKHHRLVVMELKRSDQYVKKFWSKVKVLIYGKFKDGPTKRADALDSLSEKFGFKPEDNKTFENLFGSNVKHGLKKSTIEFILTRPNLFKQIFTKKVFEHALDQMEKGSALDCETNIISKIEKCCEEKTLGQAIRVLESHISEERKFKKPFSVMENTLAALQFLDKFIKRAERWKGLTQERSNQLMKTLLDLKTGLESTLKNNRWVVPFKHRKAEIISFLRID